jgi:toxin ParE1/3/4
MRIYFSKDAENDLTEINNYIHEQDGPSRALNVLDRLQETCTSLTILSERGHVPSELKLIHIDDILEVISRPYRILYEIQVDEIHILAIWDGRRNIEQLLQRRLFRV